MLRDDLQNALKDAMKAKEMTTVSAVRMIIAGMKEKDVSARGSGKECASDAELLSMMQTMIKQRTESVKIYTEGGRPELAEKEQAEIFVIERFLPKQMNDAEVEVAIKALIAETGATSMKDMGKIMGVVMPKTKGRADGKMINEIVKTQLS